MVRPAFGLFYLLDHLTSIPPCYLLQAFLLSWVSLQAPRIGLSSLSYWGYKVTTPVAVPDFVHGSGVMNSLTANTDPLRHLLGLLAVCLFSYVFACLLPGCVVSGSLT